MRKGKVKTLGNVTGRTATRAEDAGARASGKSTKGKRLHTFTPARAAAAASAPASAAPLLAVGLGASKPGGGPSSSESAAGFCCCCCGFCSSSTSSAQLVPAWKGEGEVIWR